MTEEEFEDLHDGQPLYHRNTGQLGMVHIDDGRKFVRVEEPIDLEKWELGSWRILRSDEDEKRRRATVLAINEAGDPIGITEADIDFQSGVFRIPEGDDG